MKEAMIRTDKDTLSKMKVLAGDKSLGVYLRDIANGIEQTPVPVNELETLRGYILKEIAPKLERLEQGQINIVRMLNRVISYQDDNTISILCLEQGWDCEQKREEYNNWVSEQLGPEIDAEIERSEGDEDAPLLYEIKTELPLFNDWLRSEIVRHSADKKRGKRD